MLQRNRDSPLSTNFRFCAHHQSSVSSCFQYQTQLEITWRGIEKAPEMGHPTNKKKKKSTNLRCEKVINYDGTRAPIYSTFSMAPIRPLRPSLLQSRTRAHHRHFHHISVGIYDYLHFELIIDRQMAINNNLNNLAPTDHSTLPFQKCIEEILFFSAPNRGHVCVL